MPITPISMVFAFLIRLPALYIGMRRIGFWKVDQGALLMLAAFSTLMGFLMPAAGIMDIGGLLFRFFLFSIIVMLMLKVEFADASWLVLISSVLQIFMIAALSISPAAFLVEGISIFSVP